MDTAELPYFFRPRVGKNYDDGFRGLKTLVVGAYHYCWESDAMKYGCTYRQACIGERRSREFDRLCPIYRDRMEQHKGYYRISKSNIIEIDSYIEGEHYPAYEAFTYYMTGLSGRLLTEAERETFWESVAFYNYLQHFLPEAQQFSYKDRKEELDDDFPAFAQALQELKPSVIYIWNDAIKDAICANSCKLEEIELKFYANQSIGSTTVWTAVAHYDGQESGQDTDALIAEASVAWFSNSGKKDTARDILQIIMAYRNHEYHPDIVRNISNEISEIIKSRLQPLIYDNDVITALTGIYQQASGLNRIAGLQDLNIRRLTAGTGTIYSNFLYGEALPVTGTIPQWLTLWKSWQAADISKLDITMTEDDVLLIWIDSEEAWPFTLCDKVFSLMRKGGWKMLMLMKSDMDHQYLNIFRDSGNVMAIYEVEDSLLVEFSPDFHSEVMMYPDNMCIPYNRFTMLTPSKYLKNKVSRARFWKFLNNQMKLTDAKLLNVLDKILYDAQNSGTIFAQNINDSLCIRCEDSNSNKTVELIAKIRDAVKNYARQSNSMTYTDIQKMLNIDIPNIRKRISDLKKSKANHRSAQQ